MNTPASSRSIAVLVLASLVVTCKAAEPTVNIGDWYGGVTVGVASIKPEHHDVDSSRDAKGHASAGVFIGLRVARLPISDGLPVDLELGYQDIARHTLGYKNQGTITDLTARGHAVSLAGRVGLLTNGGFSLYGKLGLAHSRVKGSTPAGQPAIAIDGSAFGPMGGFGAEYQFAGGPLVRSEITGYGRSSSRSSAAALTVGVGYRF